MRVRYRCVVAGALAVAGGATGQSGSWFPTLEAIASGKIPPPAGMEGSAVGVFPHLASPDRDGIFRKGSPYAAHKEQIRAQQHLQQPLPYQQQRPQHQPEPEYPQHQYQHPQQQRQLQQHQQLQQEHQQRNHQPPGTSVAAAEGSDRLVLANVDVERVRREVAELRRLVAADDAAGTARGRSADLHAALAQQLQVLDMKEHSGGELSAEALSHYERALALGFAGAKDPTLLLNLGLLYSWVGKSALAVGTFTQLLEALDAPSPLDGGDDGSDGGLSMPIAVPATVPASAPAARVAEACNHRADALGQLGRFREAAADHRRALKALPGDATAWASLVAVYKEHPAAAAESPHALAPGRRDGEGGGPGGSGGEGSEGGELKTGVDWAVVARGLEADLAAAKAELKAEPPAKLHFALFTAHHERRKHAGRLQAGEHPGSEARASAEAAAAAEATAAAWAHLSAGNAAEFAAQERDHAFASRKARRKQGMEQTLAAFQRGAWVDGVGLAGERRPVFVVGHRGASTKPHSYGLELILRVPRTVPLRLFPIRWA